MMTKAEIARLRADVDPFLAGVRDLNDVCKFHFLALNAGAAVLPVQLAFFQVANVPGVCNMEIPGQVIYPLWITALGFQAWGAGGDVRIATDSGHIRIVKDNRSYCSIPCCVVGGGGLQMHYNVSAGAAVDYGMNGLDDDLFLLPTPIKVDPGQSLVVFYESNAEPTVAGAVLATIMLRGLEARTVI